MLEDGNTGRQQTGGERLCGGVEGRGEGGRKGGKVYGEREREGEEWRVSRCEGDGGRQERGDSEGSVGGYEEDVEGKREGREDGRVSNSLSLQ